ncbi:MAG: hypothetical protein IJ443_09415 [Firmicutes bacterium]|nr:hypothetical protein [Bacillota bacterium]
MRKEASLDMWKTLYNLTAELKELKPWEDLCDMDIIGIQENGREEPVFVSVMGQYGMCQGIAMYEGTRGLGYLEQMVMATETCMSQEYVAFDQEALILYWGDRVEVPNDQKKIIKDLGLKFYGKGNWPFFLSFQPRFAPWTPDAAEVRLMAETMVQIIEAVKALREKRAEVNFEEGEFCYRYFDQEQLNWMTAPARLPMVGLEVESLEVTDEVLMRRLKNQPKNEMHLLVDFMYLNGELKDKDYERPLNPFVFLVVDDATEFIVHMDMIRPEQPETELALEFLLAYGEQMGRPQSITVRNPYVMAALEDTCEKLDIKLTEAPLPKIDKIGALMLQRMEQI